MKQLIIVSAIVLTGCAAQQPTTTVTAAPAMLPYYAMTNFKADCLYGDTQRQFLEERIAEYDRYHATRAATEQSRDYYNKLKNALWGLRSACGANRQS